MSITRRMSVLMAVAALGFVARTGGLAAQSPHILVPAGTEHWGPAPPALPAGAEIAVLEGNPSSKGDVVLRLRFPAGYAVPPHWHSMTERVTVISGEFHVGMGERLDRKAGQTLLPGGYVSLPAKMPHFAWATAPTVVQIALQGPFDIFYVNPSDDPQKRQSSR